MAVIEMRIKKDGCPTYRAKIRLKGHPPVTATFDSKTMAKKWAKNTETAIEEGRYFKTAEERKHTFADAVARYERDVFPQFKVYEQKQRRRHLDWFSAHFGHYVLGDINSSRVAEMRDKLLAEDSSKGGKRAPATVHRYLASLSHLFSVCVMDWGWVNENPVQKVKKPSLPQGRIRFLSDDERERLFEAARVYPSPYIHTVIMLALCSGARMSEIMNLTWSQVDFKRKLIQLDKTKNGERRAIPLVGKAYDCLKELQRTHRRVDTDLIFARKDGLQPIEIRKQWEAVRKNAGLEDFRFHDLRHTCASYLAMNGATLPEISAILGHKTMQMVKRYAHLSDTHAVEVMERMTRRVIG